MFIRKRLFGQLRDKLQRRGEAAKVVVLGLWPPGRHGIRSWEIAGRGRAGDSAGPGGSCARKEAAIAGSSEASRLIAVSVPR